MLKRLLAIALFSVCAKADPVLDGLTLNARLDSHLVCTSSPDPCTETIGFGTPQSFVVGSGVDLSNLGGLFNIDFEGQTVTISLASDLDTSTGPHPFAFHNLQIFWDDQGVYLESFALDAANTTDPSQYNCCASSRGFGFGFSYPDVFLAGTSFKANFTLTDVAPPVPPSEVPEPTSLLLLATGIGGIAARKWKRTARRTRV